MREYSFALDCSFKNGYYFLIFTEYMESFFILIPAIPITMKFGNTSGCFILRRANNQKKKRATDESFHRYLLKVYLTIDVIQRHKRGGQTKRRVDKRFVPCIHRTFQFQSFNQSESINATNWTIEKKKKNG